MHRLTPIATNPFAVGESGLVDWIISTIPFKDSKILDMQILLDHGNKVVTSIYTYELVIGNASKGSWIPLGVLNASLQRQAYESIVDKLARDKLGKPEWIYIRYVPHV